MENAATTPAPAVAAAVAYKPLCMEMSNSHLLKMDTNDTYATANALKKVVSAAIISGIKTAEKEKEAAAAGSSESAAAPIPSLTTVGDVDKGELLFPGMIRCSKNPKNPVIFFSFETAEQRESAKLLMERFVKHRRHIAWKEVPVTEKDLQLTFRGAGTCIAGVTQAENNTAAAAANNNNSDNTNDISNKAAKRQVREGDERSSNTAQWAAFPYNVQIGKKASHCKSIIKQIANGRLQRQLSPYNCPQLLEQFSMIKSPFLSGYRNHVNFTCGYDKEQRPVIGFVSGSVTNGLVAIEDVTGRWYSAAEESSTSAAATSSGPSPSPSGAPLVPPTTNVLSVAYAKAVMSVVAQFEQYAFTDGKTYALGMLDKGSQKAAHDAAAAVVAAASVDGEPAAQRGARTEGAAASSSSSSAEIVEHPFWRRLQIRHSTVGEVMIDLEVDPSTLPAELTAAIREALVSALLAVEKTFDGAKAEAEENAYLTAKMDAKKTDDAPAAAASSDEKKEDGDNATAAVPDSHRLVTSLMRPSPLVIPTSKLVSVQWHFHTGTTMCPHEAPRETIYGASTLVENLCNMKFLLSPPSFFQVNTPTTEQMLDRVAEVAQLKPTTTLLDLCCGTGIIGICLSKFVKKIVGIEMVVSAVENAKVNAANNGVTEKTTYYAAKVEDALHQAMSAMTPEEKQDIVAIFDPPRAGMHPSVLCAVRAIPQIRRIVYISCDQQALVRDCPSLMKEPTKKFRGTPYVIDNTFGIDLFPHTPHVEMVVVLNKVSNEALEKYYEREAAYGTKPATTTTTSAAVATVAAAPAATEEKDEEAAAVVNAPAADSSV